MTVNSLGDAADVIGNGLCDTDLATAGEQCTLRAAIQEANANFGTDSISFSVTGTINLTGQLPDIFGSLNINGPGSGLLTVRRDTGGNYRIFTSTQGDVEISGLTITNGRTPDGVQGTGNNVAPSGGGILQTSGSLRLTDVAVTANTTGIGYSDLSSGSSSGGFGGFGGGIDVAGTLTMTNCVVSNNTTGRGGDGGSPGSGGRGAGIFTEANAHVTLKNVTITGNVTGVGGGPGSNTRSGDGGGIWSGGSGFQATATLDMTNVIITNNSTGTGVRFGGSGAGVFIIAGTATLTNSVVANNHNGNGSTVNGSGGRGAGIYNFATLIVSGSTISGNSTGDTASGSDNNLGGGVYNGFILTMINSTVSGNSNGVGPAFGGGVFSGVNTTLNLINCTITGNTDSNSHPGLSTGGQVNIRNTIVAGNGPGGSGPDVDGYFFPGTINSQGHNLIGSTPLSGFTATGDQVGVDPKLGPLANNGGPTLTHALLLNSPALDAGDDCVTQAAHCGDANIPQLTTDQRGFSRIADGPDLDSTSTVDIGAYEKQAVFPNLADANTNEDTQFVLGFDLDDVASVTGITATSSNTALVPNNGANISVVLASSMGVLTVNPSANLNGTTDITVTVNRTSGSTNDTFTLTVVPVNDAPSFTKGSDQSVSKNDPAQTVNNWATVISPGPADESGQTLSFQIVSNSNTSLFSAAPAISSTGTLTYTPAAGVSGSATIGVRLVDNGGNANGGSDTSATQSFNIEVLEGGSLEFSSSGYFINEGDGNATITVSRVGGSGGEARVDYATSNSTATNAAIAGADYVSTSGTLTFAHGVTSQTFSVPILVDSFDEPDTEAINLALTNVTGHASLGSQTAATLFIKDDDPPPVLSINDVSVIEGDSGTTTNAVFTVTLAGQTAQQVKVGWFTADNTATATSGDYQPASGQLVFDPGETTKTITVVVNGDSVGEANEAFLVGLSGQTNALIGKGIGVGTIINEESSFQFHLTSFPVNEGSPFRTVTVFRDGLSSAAATVRYTTSDATDVNFKCNPATAGQPTGQASRKCDYHIAAGRLRFAPGETFKQIALSIVNDVYVEGSETFTITLSAPIGANLGSAITATVPITDNDSPGQPNPIDGTAFYVRMLYVDLLGREPDPTGNAGWIHRIDFCGQPGEPPPPCDRVTVGGDGFLRSSEFFDREFFVIRLYRTALGRILTYNDVADLAFVSGFLTDADLELNKQEVVTDIMSRSEFGNMYNSLTNAQYVDTMIQTAAVTIPTPDRDTWVNALNGLTKTRAQVFREISERAEVSAKYLHEAQVVSCYYGFFTRNPDGAYFNYLQRLDSGEINLGDLANAFINAAEYRQRFGP
jgi:hypothetical protein